MNRNFSIAFAALLLSLSAQSWGVIIRHDKDDKLYTDLAADSKYAAVGQIVYKYDSGSSITTGYGTGNYIGIGNGSKKYLVTASHVIGESMDSATFTVGGNTYDIDTASRRWRTGYGSGDWDIGIAEIKDPGNTLKVAPAKFWNTALAIPANLADRLIGTGVGFGSTGTGTTGANASDKKKRAFRNRIDAHNLKYNTNASQFYGYMSDFDKNDKDNNLLDKDDFGIANFNAGQKSSRDWLDLEGQGAQGDSGGGLFADFGSGNVMIGIARQVARLGTGGSTTQYGAYTGWTTFNKDNSDWVTLRTGIQAVPEPASLLACGIGVLGVVLRRRSRLRA